LAALVFTARLAIDERRAALAAFVVAALRAALVRRVAFVRIVFQALLAAEIGVRFIALANWGWPFRLRRSVRRASVLLELYVRVAVDRHFVLRAKRARGEQRGHRCLIGNGEAFVAPAETAGKAT
jgi:hypothetical protein